MLDLFIPCDLIASHHLVSKAFAYGGFKLLVYSVGDHSFAVFKDLESSEGEPVFESVLEPKHGQGLRRVSLPKLSSLIDDARSSDSENTPAMVSLAAAVEDIFTCAGGFADTVWPNMMPNISG